MDVQHGQELSQDQGLSESTKPSQCECHLVRRSVRISWGAFACSIHPGFKKRQDPASVCGSSASPSPTLNTASIESVQSVESVSSLSVLVQSAFSVASVQSVQSVQSGESLSSIGSQFQSALSGLASLQSGVSSTTLPTTQQPPSPPSTTVAPPPPPSTPSEAPEATCTAVARLDAADVSIWANYITDNGVALEATEKDFCALGLTGWTVATVSRDWTAPDGTKWTANQMFSFSLSAVTRPQELQCIATAIMKAGGPPDTQNCPFAPLLNPPK
jgi:hypothetical protein